MHIGLGWSIMGDPMNKQKKDGILENLSAAGVIAVLAMVVALISFFIDRAAYTDELSRVAKLAGAQSSGAPLRVSDSAFRSIFPLEKEGHRLYGAVATLGDNFGYARISAIFSAEGTLEAVEIIDAAPNPSNIAIDGWFSEFLGKGGGSPYPVRKTDVHKLDVINGATISFMQTGAVLNRLSSAVKKASGVGTNGGK